MSRRFRAGPGAIFAVAIALFASGCGTRTLRASFYEDPQTAIVLRQQTRGGEIVDQGYSHPVAIAPVRLAHILSRIDIRTEQSTSSVRESALPTESLYVLADHLALALGRVDSSQEIVVYFTLREKRWGIFDRNHLYSFIAYARDDSLYIHLSRIGWEIPNNSAARNERLPEPRIGDFPMEFRVIASTAMTAVDSQSLAIDWRDPIFKRPTRTSVSRDGQVVRRTILMESEVETDLPEEEIAPSQLPETLSAATLRSLANLEEERSRGEVTEAEYNARRREIIRADPASKVDTEP